MSEGSPFKIGVIVMPLGPPKPDSFGILDRDGRHVAWLTLEQVEAALAEWHRLAETRRIASKGLRDE